VEAPSVVRKLAAIFAADVEGYNRDSVLADFARV
jgi:hypothetical protein